jgi:hypothetical protein
MDYRYGEQAKGAIENHFTPFFDKSIDTLLDVQIISSRRLKNKERFWNLTNADRQEANVLKQIKVIAVLAMSVFLLTGCLYSRFTTPLDTNLDQTVLGHKVGKSSLYSVLWLFAWGDMSVAAAARQGGLSTLNHMDMETHMILFGLYTRQSILVYGD